MLITEAQRTRVSFWIPVQWTSTKGVSRRCYIRILLSGLPSNSLHSWHGWFIVFFSLPLDTVRNIKLYLRPHLIESLNNGKWQVHRGTGKISETLFFFFFNLGAQFLSWAINTARGLPISNEMGLFLFIFKKQNVPNTRVWINTVCLSVTASGENGVPRKEQASLAASSDNSQRLSASKPPSFACNRRTLYVIHNWTKDIKKTSIRVKL